MFIVFLMVLASLAIIFFAGAAIRALVLHNRAGQVLKVPPGKEGEDAPADQPVPRRQAVEAARVSLVWQAVAAFFAAVLAVIGLKQLNDRRKAQEAKAKLAR